MLKQKFVQETLSQQSLHNLDKYLDTKDDKITFNMLKDIGELLLSLLNKNK